MKRIVLAYSGGLETSVAIPWLVERFGAEVIAVTLDLGQNENLEATRERALAAGAVTAHVIDAREEFAREYVLPALQAGAVYEGRYPLASALSRPLIARKIVDMAGREGASTVAHGCARTGNDHVRFDLSVRAIDPSLQVIAPSRLWGMTRAGAIAYAQQRGIEVPVTRQASYSTDENLWGRSVACGELEDPWQEPPEDVFTLTKWGHASPATPAYVELTFDQGVPTHVNGVGMGLPELIHSVATIAGVHGVGRIDMVENRLVGAKSREVYESPAAVVLHAAHADLQGLVVPKDLQRLCRELGGRYADLVYDGLWFTPTRPAIGAFFATIQPRVTGQVRLRLSRGESRLVGRRSPFALDAHTLAGPQADGSPDRSAAEGFSKAWGLPVETMARQERQSAADGASMAVVKAVGE